MGFSKLFTSVRSVPRNVIFSKIVRNICKVPSPEKNPSEFLGQGGEGVKDGTKPGIILGMYEVNKKLELTPAAEEINQKSGGKIHQYMNELSCELKPGKAVVVTDVTPSHGPVALVCLGAKDAGYDELEGLDVAKENIRSGIGAGMRALEGRCVQNILVDGASAPGAAAEGALLAAWRFDEFKSQRRPLPTVSEVCGDTAQWKRGAVLAHAQNWARYLSDMPANIMTPVDLAQAALDVLCPLGVSVDARDRNWIQTQNMQAFLAVARGSCAEPIFLECTYRGDQSDRPSVLLAAKGVTFDSGGLCLKQCDEMVENRGSMAGAAAVLAAMQAIAKLKVPINVSCVIPICENMVSGQCMKVGDVVMALNGLSIQIEDTDMEGRLMLADALVYGQSVYKPALVVDVATLTPGVQLATGGGAFGCFSNNEAAWDGVRRAGACAGDRPWRLPLWDYYTAQLTNDLSVDLRNRGSGKATPCLGAAFLQKFVCTEWVHMDITGVGKLAYPAPSYLLPERMSGRPTRTIATFLQNIATDSVQDQCHTKNIAGDSVQVHNTKNIASDSMQCHNPSVQSAVPV